MHKVYDIITPYTRKQTHSVVAKDMATAERLFLERYPGTTIESIILHAEYVLLSTEVKDDSN